jgi:hypothetical protein
VEIDGIDCSRVSRLAPLTVTSDRSGGGKAAFPTIELSLAAPGSPSWSQWKQATAEGKGKARAGAVVYLAPDAHTELGRISLSGLRLLSLTQSKVGASRVGSVAASLACESMALAVRS